MRAKGFSSRASAAFVALGITLAGPAPAPAQTSGTHSSSFTKLPDAVVAHFKADPQSLLASYPAGGRSMTTMARNLLLSDPTLLDPLMNLAAKATPAQASAIGAGAAQAARILVVINPEMAAQIQLAVAQSGVAGVVAAFSAASSAASSVSTAPLSVSNAPAPLSTPSPSPSPASSSGSADTGSEPLAGAPSEPTSSSSAFTSGNAATPSGGLMSATTRSTSPSRSAI